MIRRPWSKQDIRLVRRLYPDTVTAEIAEQLGRPIHTVYRMAYQLGLQKVEGFTAEVSRQRSSQPDHGGVQHRFEKGHVPANKGLRRPGYTAGRMAETQFKKGQRPHTWLPVGSCRFSKEGYLLQKCEDTGYTPRDWVPVHHLVWEEHTRKRMPKNKVLVFRDGDKQNFDFDNLELISRSELMRRNTIHNLPAPLKEVIVLRGAINRKINRRMRDAQEQAV